MGLLPRRRVVQIANASAGLADTMAASFSTFVAGLYAVRILPEEGLALFSLFMTGVITCMLIPQQLFLAPIRMAANLSPDREIPPAFQAVTSAKWAILFAMAAVCTAGLPLAAEVSLIDYTQMAAGASLMCLTGAITSHMRGLLHIAGLHLHAAAMSLLSLSTSLTLVMFLSISSITFHSPFGLPFIVLIVGYITSTLVWIKARRAAPEMPRPNLENLRTRFFYLAPELLTQIVGYLMLMLVAIVLGSSELALLEATRIAASPVFMIVGGLAVFMMPSIVRRLRADPRQTTLRRIASLHAAIVSIGAAYGAFLSVMGPLMNVILQRPTETALSVARATHFGFEGAANTLPSFAMALQRARFTFFINLVANGISILLLYPLLLLVHVFALPVAQLISALIRIGGVYKLVRQIER